MRKKAESIFSHIEGSKNEKPFTIPWFLWSILLLKKTAGVSMFTLNSVYTRFCIFAALCNFMDLEPKWGMMNLDP